MKAYVLSTIHGTVQIGCTVFQPCTKERFHAPLKGAKKMALHICDVQDATMKSAESALRFDGQKEK